MHVGLPQTLEGGKQMATEGVTDQASDENRAAQQATTVHQPYLPQLEDQCRHTRPHPSEIQPGAVTLKGVSKNSSGTHGTQVSHTAAHSLCGHTGAHTHRSAWQMWTTGESRQRKHEFPLYRHCNLPIDLKMFTLNSENRVYWY